jgi:hypothetical protein
MSRAELLEARKRVQEQYERLAGSPSYSGWTAGPSSKSALLAELQTILDEIDAELTETRPNIAP